MAKKMKSKLDLKKMSISNLDRVVAGYSLEPIGGKLTDTCDPPQKTDGPTMPYACNVCW